MTLQSTDDDAKEVGTTLDLSFTTSSPAAVPALPSTTGKSAFDRSVVRRSRGGGAFLSRH